MGNGANAMYNNGWANGYANGAPYGAACAANGYGYAPAPYERTGACMHDVECAKESAAKDAEIAMLKSERYADKVREDAKQYGIEVYKELKGNITEVTKQITDEIAAIKEKENNRWTDQLVVNANISNGLTALSGQVKGTADLVAQITRTAVPKSAICNFDCGCNGCGNNI